MIWMYEVLGVKTDIYYGVNFVVCVIDTFAQWFMWYLTEHPPPLKGCKSFLMTPAEEFSKIALYNSSGK